MRSFNGSEWVRRSSGLDVQRLAVEVTARVCRLVGGVPPMLRSQQEQAVKAVARIPLAIAEGQGRTGRDALHPSDFREPKHVVAPHVEVYCLRHGEGDHGGLGGAFRSRCDRTGRRELSAARP